MAASIPLRPSDLSPVSDWLAEVRGRLEEWGRGMRHVSTEEWRRFQTSVKSAISTQRVEGVLNDFLTRIGVRSEREAIVEGLTEQLRSRVLHFRQGKTIEDYQNFLSVPPRIEV